MLGRAGDCDEHVRVLGEHGHREQEERAHRAGEDRPAAAVVEAF